jgi:hypothetical protein
VPQISIIIPRKSVIKVECNVVIFASLRTPSGGSPSIALCWVGCIIYGCALGGVGPLISLIQIDVFGLSLGGYVQMSAQIHFRSCQG